jgi:ABC-type spermidine/putrescine transport system permease subunit I
MSWPRKSRRPGRVAHRGVKGRNRREAGPFWQTRFAVVPLLVFILAGFYLPLFKLLSLSLFDPTFTTAHFRRLLTVPVYAIALWTTLKISFLVTAGCLLLGYPVAYLLVHTPQHLRQYLLVCILLPFWTSVLVRAYAWMVLLQDGGPVMQSLRSVLGNAAPKLMFNLNGVLIGMVHYLLPFMIFALASVMRNIDVRYLQAAESLGGGPLRTWWHIYLPLSVPGIRSGCILVFVMALGFFLTPALLGSRQESTIPMMIGEQIEDFLNWGFAAALSITLLAVSFIVLAPTYRFLRLGFAPK